MQHNPAPLTRLLIRKAVDMQTAAEASFHDHRLSLPRAGLLSHLYNGPLPLNELADRLHCGRSNMTAMIDRLEREGWVRREASPADRRATLAVLTDTGRETCERAVAALAKWEDDLHSSLGPENAETLKRLLSTL